MRDAAASDSANRNKHGFVSGAQSQSETVTFLRTRASEFRLPRTAAKEPILLIRAEIRISKLHSLSTINP